MQRALVVEAVGVEVLVTVVVRVVAALVRQGLFQRARTLRHLVGEVLEVAVVLGPQVAHLLRPVASIQALPLSVEVPTQRDRPTPQVSLQKVTRSMKKYVG